MASCVPDGVAVICSILRNRLCRETLCAALSAWFYGGLYCYLKNGRASCVAAGTARRRELWQDRPAYADATIEDVTAEGQQAAVLVAGGPTDRRVGWPVSCREKERPGRVSSRRDGRAARLWQGRRWLLCWGQPIFFAADSMAFLVFVWSGPGCSGGRWPGCGAVLWSFCWGWPRSGA